MRARSQEAAYLSNVVRRLRTLLGAKLIGVYVGGSYALGDYQPGRSDLDVAAVVSDPISPDLRELVVARLRHESLPCPARALELVIYRLQVTRSALAETEYELNLNSGAEMPARVDDDAALEASHWFPIDRSILHQAGISLVGPPASEAFAAIQPEILLPVLVDSMRWHRRNPSPSGDAVLNACRTLHYTTVGKWSSKPAAGRWAVEQGLAPEQLVARASGPGGGASLDSAAVDEFLADVELRVSRLSRLRR